MVVDSIHQDWYMFRDSYTVPSFSISIFIDIVIDTNTGGVTKILGRGRGPRL